MIRIQEIASSDGVFDTTLHHPDVWYQEKHLVYSTSALLAMTKEKIMAKKSKRQVRARPTKASTARGGDFNPDYSAVKKDLKTIGSLAGFFVLVLIVLSFFLR